MPEALSFCLARAQRPLLHVERTTHLQNDPNVLSFVPDQQLLRLASRGIHSSGLDELSTSGITSRLELVKDKSILYLGETCVFYLTLSNQGSSAASAVTVKVECSVAGGSNAVLHDNSQSPLPQLPAPGRHDVIVQTDIKEQGVITIVASAVYTDRYGERKYHVQFFKFQSASPLRVETRVRCLPHIQQPARPVLPTNSSSSTAGQLLGTSCSTSSNVTISGTRPYCFLEVSVDNTTPLPLVLHAVKLLPSAGLAAQQLSISEQQAQQQQQQQQQLEHLNLQQQQQGLPQGNLQQQQQGQGAEAKRDSGGSGKLEPAGDDSDTRLQHDIGDSCNRSSAAHPAGAPQQQAQDRLVQLQQQQQAQVLCVGTALQQQPRQQQPVQQQQQPILGALLSSQPLLVVIPPGGGSHNYLWQIEQQPARRGSSSSNGSAAAVGPSSSSSTYLGRLELHWSTLDGKTGRLLTQQLSRPVSTVAGSVLLQLVQLLPLPAAAAAAVGPSQQQQQGSYTDLLQVGVPVRAVLSVTAAAGQQQQQAGIGPLLVLHNELTSSGSSGGAVTAASTSSSLLRTSDSSSNTRQQQQRAGSSAASGVASGAEQQSRVHQQRRSGSGGFDSSRDLSAVALQGKRSQRVQRVLPGQSVNVEFVLLPLKRGWVRLPNFVVMSEADGRLLDSVHDVQVLVV